MNRVKKEVCAKRVYQDGYTGKGVRIALLDTGVEPLIGLKNRIMYFKDYINGKIINATIERETTNKYYVSVIVEEKEVINEKINPINTII